MGTLVESKRNEIFCDSLIVSKKFKQKHGYVINHIKNVQNDIVDLGVTMFTPKIVIEKREYRGQTYVAYLMNRDFFSLLVMRFKGKKAVEWQIKFIAAFNAMEHQLVLEKTNASDGKWVENRHILKIGRREETDVIKKFVDYATAQGSKSAKFYYKHFTTATYRALDLMYQRKPKLRNTMNIYEMAQLLLAEQVARNSIKKYMELGRGYKDIYNSVKDDLVSFSNNLRLS